MNSRIFSFALVCAGLAIGTPAAAQEPEDPFETARFRMGVIRFTPVLQITSLGTDSNVFNESFDKKSDTTAAVGPAVQLWMRPWGTRLSGKFGGQYLYFKEYDNQRAWNTANEARLEVPLTRLTPFVAGSLVSSRDRQGYEIDSRARRRDDSFTVGSGVQFSGKTSVVVSFRRVNQKYEEDADESPLGTQLAEALDRREDLTKVQLRYALTPLTTFVVDTDFGRDRFRNTNLRDGDSLRVMPGFELKPMAMISGRIFVGYRQFTPLSASLPEYRGLVTGVDATYIRDATRFQAKVERDLAYSFLPTRPYYALTDFGLTITQRIASSWEVLARGSRQSLAYRQLLSSGSSASAGKPDRGYIYGAGVGYRVGETLRLGLDTNYYTRTSEIDGRRDYEGVRVFGSISYGRQQ